MDERVSEIEANLSVREFYPKNYNYEQWQRQTTTILETTIQQQTYYSTYCCDGPVYSQVIACQCIAVEREDGSVEVGYATKSLGFPHPDSPSVQPIFSEVIPIQQVLSISFSADHSYFNSLAIQVKERERPWLFYFSNGDILAKWVKLIVILRAQDIQRFGQETDLQEIKIIDKNGQLDK